GGRSRRGRPHAGGRRRGRGGRRGGGIGLPDHRGAGEPAFGSRRAGGGGNADRVGGGDDGAEDGRLDRGRDDGPKGRASRGRLRRERRRPGGLLELRHPGTSARSSRDLGSNTSQTLQQTVAKSFGCVSDPSGGSCSWP